MLKSERVKCYIYISYCIGCSVLLLFDFILGTNAFRQTDMAASFGGQAPFNCLLTADFWLTSSAHFSIFYVQFNFSKAMPCHKEVVLRTQGTPRCNYRHTHMYSIYLKQLWPLGQINSSPVK